MTKPRIRRPVRSVEASSFNLERWLYWCLTIEGFMPKDATPEEEASTATITPRALEAAWHAHGAEILAAWIEAHPGERPSAWWRFEAPKQPTLRCKKFTAEQRMRVGGRGTPEYTVLNQLPRFFCGVPIEWVRDWQISYYTGCARDRSGKPIGREFAGQVFPAEHFDVNDPPTFEAQASFLQRHACLGEAEAARLSARDFQPEVLPACFWA